MAQIPRRVFFLIYDQVEILDFAGAYDVFTIANIASGDRAFELHTVSPAKGSIGPMRHPAQPVRGLHLEATHTIDAWSDQPIDMLVIPGGPPDLMLQFKQRYPAAIDWIAGQRPKVKILATVCVGALIAAQADVFDGLKATTHGANIGDLEKLTQGRGTVVVSGLRFVDDGQAPNVISSAGVTAGIDMAFHVVGKLLGASAGEPRGLWSTISYSRETVADLHLGLRHMV
jgi:transcriptional regulator GlxA family with amidase domain